MLYQPGGKLHISCNLFSSENCGVGIVQMRRLPLLRFNEVSSNTTEAATQRCS